MTRAELRAQLGPFFSQITDTLREVEQRVADSSACNSTLFGWIADAQSMCDRMESCLTNARGYLDSAAAALAADGDLTADEAEIVRRELVGAQTEIQNAREMSRFNWWGTVFGAAGSALFDWPATVLFQIDRMLELVSQALRTAAQGVAGAVNAAVQTVDWLTIGLVAAGMYIAAKHFKEIA